MTMLIVGIAAVTIERALLQRSLIVEYLDSGTVFS
jgi:hypothetical protein